VYISKLDVDAPVLDVTVSSIEHFCDECNRRQRFEFVRDTTRGRVRWEQYRCLECGRMIEFAVT